jgi:putative CocE/NonD family hydrolase
VSPVDDQNESAEGHRTLFRVRVLPDIRVRMRDGVELAARIVRPDAVGRFPALMAYNAYRILTALCPTPSDREYSNVIHAPHYFAERGYVSVYFDVRGTGASGGSSPDMYSDAERHDGYDMVEWIAAQPWSNGNVGMWGKSYGAVAAWQIAALAPPHLKAVIIRSGTEDLYRDWAYPGGVPRSFFMYGGYTGMMTALNFAPPDVETTGEKWATIWQEHLDTNVPWSIAMLQHPTDDDYWRARSVRPDYDRIKCAVFVIEGWADWYQTAELRAFEQLKGPKRALIGPWAHYWPEDAFPGPRIDARPEYLRWFDQFLKGIDTGVLREPPVTIFVRKYQPPAPMIREEPGYWRHENEWPPTRTRYTRMYLGANGTLESRPLETDSAECDHYVYRASVGAASGFLGQGLIPPWANPLDQQRDDGHSLTYTTPPLQSDIEVTGNPVAELFVSSSADVAYFAVRLCDVAPDGTSKLVTDGALSAAHRNSDVTPEPVIPGVVYPLRIDLRSTSYIFSSGHRIRVSIASADFQNAWPSSKAAINTVVRGAACSSCVILPIIPQQQSQWPTPALLTSPNLQPAVLARPEYQITSDLINETTMLSVTQTPLLSHAPGISRSTYLVSDVNPADAIIENTVEYVVAQSGQETIVRAHMVTASDARRFLHSVDVEVTIDGRHHFRKNWAVSVPRVCS